MTWLDRERFLRTINFLAGVVCGLAYSGFLVALAMPKKPVIGPSLQLQDLVAKPLQLPDPVTVCNCKEKK